MYLRLQSFVVAIFLIAGITCGTSSNAQIIISQYYEGGGTNKWIELTNLGPTTVNTATDQLKLGLWSVTGSTGNINITGAPSQVMDLTVVIPSKASVLIGNPSNGNEVPYLTSASAAQVNGTVINFNGNDGIALLDNAGNIIDQFGHGINAADKSYYRNLSVTGPSATFVLSQWTNVTLPAVQAAVIPNPARLNYHLENNCVQPESGASNLVFYTAGATSIGGAFSAGIADDYLVLIGTSPTLTDLPQNTEVYSIGDNIGGANVIGIGPSTAFYAKNLSPSTNYYFFVFAYNNTCTGGPVYLTTYLGGNKSTTAVQAPQALNYYFGNLHAHSSYSDGNMDDPTKTPADDYTFAKESMCMDFLGISEHNHTGAGMKLANWRPGRTQATAATTPSFVAMYGMELGVINDGGHAVVYGMDSLLGWETNQYDVFVARGNFTGANGLFDKVNQKGGNAFVTLAHPEFTDYNNIFSSAYLSGADDAVVGTALESGPAYSTSLSYNNAGVSMGFLDYYKILLSKGYHVGPTIDHDNHNLTFGRTARTRLAIIAPQLTETALLSSMRQMRFYATQDCSAKVSFTIGGQQMGSIMTMANSPVLSIQCETASPITSIRVMTGEPGSGTFPTQLANITTANATYTDVSIPNFGQRYYYLDITEADGSKVVTAPIWYTRIDGALAVGTITSFIAINQPSDVLLKWSAFGEDDNNIFTIERSIDGGRSFQMIGSLPGKGNNGGTNNYSFTDNQPFAGQAYYRIHVNDVSNHTQYSAVRTINRSSVNENMITVFPNPVGDVANLHINSTVSGNGVIELFDMSGRKLSTSKALIKKGEQVVTFSTVYLSKGQYIVRVLLNGTQMIRTIHK